MLHWGCSGVRVRLQMEDEGLHLGPRRSDWQSFLFRDSPPLGGSGVFPPPLLIFSKYQHLERDERREWKRFMISTYQLQALKKRSHFQFKPVQNNIQVIELVIQLQMMVYSLILLHYLHTSIRFCYVTESCMFAALSCRQTDRLANVCSSCFDSCTIYHDQHTHTDSQGVNNANCLCGGW